MAVSEAEIESYKARLTDMKQKYDAMESELKMEEAKHADAGEMAILEVDVEDLRREKKLLVSNGHSFSTCGHTDSYCVRRPSAVAGAPVEGASPASSIARMRSCMMHFTCPERHISTP